MKQISVTTGQRTHFAEITREVQAMVDKSQVRSGFAVVFVPHTTAGITINEHADPDMVRDMAMALDRIVPWNDPGYRHNEGNSAAHVKASMMGSSVTVLIEHGRLQLGTWQGIFLCEFDGPRTRHVLVKVQHSTE